VAPEGLEVKFNKGDLIWIQWEDHFHDYTQGWRDVEDMDTERVIIQSTGFVLKDTPTHVYFSGTFQEHDDRFSGGYSAKLKNCILKHKVLMKAKK
jgi:hypothetical protein